MRSPTSRSLTTHIWQSITITWATIKSAPGVTRRFIKPSGLPRRSFLKSWTLGSRPIRVMSCRTILGSWRFRPGPQLMRMSSRNSKLIKSLKGILSTRLLSTTCYSKRLSPVISSSTNPTLSNSSETASKTPLYLFY